MAKGDRIHYKLIVMPVCLDRCNGDYASLQIVNTASPGGSAVRDRAKCHRGTKSPPTGKSTLNKCMVRRTLYSMILIAKKRTTRQFLRKLITITQITHDTLGNHLPTHRKSPAIPLRHLALSFHLPSSSILLSRRRCCEE